MGLTLEFMFFLVDKHTAGLCCVCCVKYLKHSCLNDPGIDDNEGFKQLQHSMTHVGLSEKEKIAIFTVVAAVLHLGNVAFEENTESMKGKYILLSDWDRSPPTHARPLVHDRW